MQCQNSARNMFAKAVKLSDGVWKNTLFAEAWSSCSLKRLGSGFDFFDLRPEAIFSEKKQLSSRNETKRTKAQ